MNGIETGGNKTQDSISHTRLNKTHINNKEMFAVKFTFESFVFEFQKISV